MCVYTDTVYILYIYYNAFVGVETVTKKIWPLYLHLRIHCLDQWATILTFYLHLVVPHDYVISLINSIGRQRCTLSESLSYSYPSEGFLSMYVASHWLPHTRCMAKLAVLEELTLQNRLVYRATSHLPRALLIVFSCSLPLLSAAVCLK